MTDIRSWTLTTWLELDDNGTRCKETSYSKLEVDHIVPWSKGGTTTLDNAQLLCKVHNSGKGNRV